MQTEETEERASVDFPIEHFPDRSARWLFQDKQYVRGLVEIVANELVAFLDFDQLTPLNRSFISDTLREQESDLVFSVPFRRGSETDELLIYILLEHQSTVDPLMGFRVLFYMYLLLLILHRRPAEEHSELLTLVDRHTEEMEVSPMAQSMADMLLERGKAQGIEQGKAQGIEQGVRETTIKNILSILNARFPQDNPQRIQQELELILDTDRLTQLHLRAVQASSFEAFLQALD